MKIVSKRFLLTILLVLFRTAVFPQADPNCPCGPYVGSGDGDPPPPPGLCNPCPVPIDESIMILVVIAVLFGVYIIYKNNLKTKSPI